MKSKFALAGFAIVVCLIGCSSGNGSDGFRSQDLGSKADIQKQIDQVTASTSIAPGAKPMILSGLKKRLEAAK